MSPRAAVPSPHRPTPLPTRGPSVAAVFECIVISLLWGRVPVENPPNMEVLAKQVHTYKEMGPDGTATTIYRSLLAKDGLVSTVPGDGAKTLYENFFKVGVQRYGKEQCLGTRTGPKLAYKWLSYAQVGDMAMDFGRGLNKLGAPRKCAQCMGTVAGGVSRPCALLRANA